MDFANVKDWYAPVDGASRDVWKVTDASGRVIWRKKFFMTYYSNDDSTDTYVTTFSGNGATSGGMQAISGKAGETYTMPQNGFLRTGHTFAGKWNTLPSGAGTAYTPGAQYAHQSDLQLYAQWTANSYTITFYGNQATSGSMSQVTATYASGVTLPANGFARTGYTFSEWCEKQDGTGQHYADEDYLTMPAANMQLYAQWTLNKYVVSISVQPSGGGSATGAGEYEYGSTATVAATASTGYKFSSWSDGGAQTHTVSVTSSVSLTAYFQKLSYTVTFDGNGGAPSESSRQVSHGEAVGDLPSASRDGYSFNGWYTDASGGSPVTSATVVTQAVTFYAQWTQVSTDSLLVTHQSDNVIASSGDFIKIVE